MDSIIYIVDDDVFFADVLKRKLVKHGFSQIYTCTCASDFLSEMNVKPDLVFLDYDLGDLTGIDVLLKLKKYSPNSQIIMVSGQEKEKIVNDALDMGAHRYISKGQVNMNNQIEEAILTVELN